jgi:hypothetical protein
VIGIVFILISIIAFVFTLKYYFGTVQDTGTSVEKLILLEMQNTNTSNMKEFLQSNVEISAISVNYSIAQTGYIIIMLLEAILLLLAVQVTFKALKE